MAFQDFNLQQDDYESEIIDFPSVIFKVDGVLYCINSEYIETLIQKPSFTPIPEASEDILGVFPYRENFITTLDLRTIFGIQKLSDKYEEFVTILDEKKRDHINWFSTLEDSVKNDVEFSLPKDPRCCDFGKWFYEFKSESNTVNNYLRKIELPHKMLFEAACKIDECRSIEDLTDRQRHMNSILTNTKNTYMNDVLALLDEAKNVFQNTLCREMVIIFREVNMGISVDEVLMVDHLEIIDDENSKNALRAANSSKYIIGVRKSDKLPDDIILEINVPILLAG